MHTGESRGRSGMVYPRDSQHKGRGSRKTPQKTITEHNLYPEVIPSNGDFSKICYPFKSGAVCECWIYQRITPLPMNALEANIICQIAIIKVAHELGWNDKIEKDFIELGRQESLLLSQSK